MSPTFDECIAVAIAPEAVRTLARGTKPPTFGVYRVPDDASCARRYRFGRHPSRAVALAREFGRCELVNLFLVREHAETVARHMNALPPPSQRDEVRLHPASAQAQATALHPHQGERHVDEPVATLGAQTWTRPAASCRAH